MIEDPDPTQGAGVPGQHLQIFHPDFIHLIRISRGCSEEATRAEISVLSIADGYEKVHPFAKNSGLTDREKTLIRANIRGFWSWLISMDGSILGLDSTTYDEGFRKGLVQGRKEGREIRADIINKCNTDSLVEIIEQNRKEERDEVLEEIIGFRLALFRSSKCPETAWIEESQFLDALKSTGKKEPAPEPEEKK